MANNFVEHLHNPDIIEQKSDVSTNSSHNSPPQKRAKLRTEEAINTTAELDEPSPRGEELQQPTNARNQNTKQPLKDGIFNFYLPSEEETNPTSVENLEPNSAGLKSSRRTRGVWHKSLEESHSAQIREISLLGHLLCPEGTQQKILESDIFHILAPEGVTEVGALYKVSPSKFVLVFENGLNLSGMGRNLSLLPSTFLST